MTREMLELRKAGAQWKNALKRVGEALLLIEKKGQCLDEAYKVLRDEFAMPRATAEAALLWARGELGTDETAELLVRKVPHSTLCNMSAAAREQICRGKHKIVSPSEGRVVNKSLSEFTRLEASRNIGRQGIRPIKPETVKPPAMNYFRAERVEAHKQGVLFSGGPFGATRMLVTPALIRAAMDLLTADEAVA